MAVYDRETKKRTGAMGKIKRFSTISNNLKIISNRLQADDELVKLLVRTKPDALTDGVSVKMKERATALQDNIQNRPVLPKGTETKNFVFLQFSDVTGFKDSPSDGVIYTLVVDVICNLDCWNLDDYKIRPYSIMERVDDVIADTKITSYGPVEFMGASAMKVNEEMAGLTAVYRFGEI